MSVCIMIPAKVFCDKCGWSESLDYDNHGPFVYMAFGDALLNDLVNRPKVCPSCGNTPLKVERGIGGVYTEPPNRMETLGYWIENPS